jgi:hypothetical protein
MTIYNSTTPDESGNPPKDRLPMSRESFLRWCEECDALKSGIAFPGPDGFGHYRYAYDKVIDSFRLDRGPGLALTWLEHAMPTYRVLLGPEDAEAFEATIKAVCAEMREWQRRADGWK